MLLEEIGVPHMCPKSIDCLGNESELPKVSICDVVRECIQATPGSPKKRC